MSGNPDSQVVSTDHHAPLVNALDEVGEAVVIVDNDWRITYVNGAYLGYVKRTPEELIGRTPMEAIQGFRRSIFWQSIEKCRTSRLPISRIGFSNVLNRWLLVRVFPIDGGMMMLANDATESIVRQVHIAEKALTDSLTKLGNKIALEQQIISATKSSDPFSLIVLTVEKIHAINDAHGYSVGDLVLLEIASNLQSATVEGETLFRVSGNEFAVFGTGIETPAIERALGFQSAAVRPVEIGGGMRVDVRAHAGLVEFPRDGQDTEELLKRAGMAAREANRVGQQGVIYRAELEAASRDRLFLAKDLREALEARGQLQLWIQPKVDLQTDALVGGEALIRWLHPKRGLLSPVQFLPIASDNDVMPLIDRWVILNAAHQIRNLISRGFNIPISINLSVESLSDKTLVEFVRSALKRLRVPPELLEIEIPEGAIMRDADVSARILAELHAMGVKLSIDDFGTGYSSFAYLAQFPVYALKVDRSFVRDIARNEQHRNIVKGIVRLAHSLSMQVVAEGAETDAEVTQLRRLKCDSLQGYAVAKPLAFNDFVVFARSRAGQPSIDPFSI